MASNPPAQCCITGKLHEGEPVGKLSKIGETDVYISEPSKKTTNVILFLPDVIGIWANSKLMADQFAANGYLVILVDLFHGDAIPVNPPGDKPFDFPSWLKNHPADRVQPVVDEIVEYARTTLGAKRVGAVGYCFGAKYAIRELGKPNKVDVVYVAHPSFVEIEEVEAIQGPLSIAAAETDQIFPEEKRRQTEDVLKKLNKTYQLVLYSGVSHGFAVKGDLSVRVNKWSKEQAFKQAVDFFNEYLLVDDGSKL